MCLAACAVTGIRIPTFSAARCSAVFDGLRRDRLGRILSAPEATSCTVPEYRPVRAGPVELSAFVEEVGEALWKPHGPGLVGLRLGDGPLVELGVSASARPSSAGIQ